MSYSYWNKMQYSYWKCQMQYSYWKCQVKDFLSLISKKLCLGELPRDALGFLCFLFFSLF